MEGIEEYFEEQKKLLLEEGKKFAEKCWEFGFLPHIKNPIKKKTDLEYLVINPNGALGVVRDFHRKAYYTIELGEISYSDLTRVVENGRREFEKKREAITSILLSNPEKALEKGLLGESEKSIAAEIFNDKLSELESIFNSVPHLGDFGNNRIYVEFRYSDELTFDIWIYEYHVSLNIRGSNLYSLPSRLFKSPKNIKILKLFLSEHNKIKDEMTKFRNRIFR